MEMEAAGQWYEATAVPQAVIDGGGEEWGVLEDIVERRLDDLAVGDVLEVITQNRAVGSAIPTWCTLHGHELLDVVAEGETVRFCVEKHGRE